MISLRTAMKGGQAAERIDLAREEFLSRFSANLPAFAAELGLGEREVASLRNDALVFQWAIDTHEQYRVAARDWLSYVKRLRDGDDQPCGEGLEIPERASLSSHPPGEPVPGIFRRVGSLVERIKALPAYTPTMGEMLGFGECEWMVDAAWARPFIRLRRVGNGYPEVIWQKFQYDGLLLEVDRDGTGFALLGVGTVPNFIDTHPAPPAGSNAVWDYRAIYQVGDEPAGRWSEVVRLSFPPGR